MSLILKKLVDFDFLSGVPTIRPMELKELFTVLPFSKIDAVFFHFSLFLFLDFGTYRHQI